MSNNVYHEIQEILFRFMRSLDNKDWDDVRDCLLDNIYCDYSSFRSEEPGQIPRDRYVVQRKEALAELKTQHNLSNLLIKCCNEIAEVKCSYVIYRFHPAFDGKRTHFFHSYGQYIFKLQQEGLLWKMASITQILLISDGNPQLHAATRKL